jgi:hypothetical protein
MRYRRGFQRIYAVLVVCWIAVVALTVLSGHWQPWKASFFQPVGTDQSKAREFTVSPEEFLAHADFYVAQAARRETTRKWTWALLLSIIPPLVLYFALFYVAPWIYSGFSPAPHI